MPLFGRGRDNRPENRQDARPAAPVRMTVPGIAAAMQAEHFQPVPGEPLRDAIPDHELRKIVLAMYGYAAAALAPSSAYPTGPSYTDSFCGDVTGRRVIVTNVHVFIAPKPLVGWGRAAACTVDLGVAVMPLVVQPRHQRHSVKPTMIPEVATGDADFDAQFRVFTVAGTGPVLVPPVRQLLMTRGEWSFYFSSGQLTCLAKDGFVSIGDISGMITSAITIARALPDGQMPERLHQALSPDLAARLARLHDLDGALALLMSLNPAERDQLARSNTPLARFAHVTTPAEAMGVLQSLDMQSRMQVMGMFSNR